MLGFIALSSRLLSRVSRISDVLVIIINYIGF